LRDKIQIAGVDIAGQVALEYKLPPVTKQDDVENYSTSNVTSLSYRMGILSRPDWRRMTRAYEIRRDLELEGDWHTACPRPLRRGLSPTLRLEMPRINP
jgi:hypothetical protein